MNTVYKRQTVVIFTSALVLLIPLIAMQFTPEVNWQPLDFLVAGVLLIGAGLLSEFIWRKLNTRMYRIAALVTILLVLLLTWIELAVGIFDSPLAGS
ncbi:MAG TPA: hypothetical protein DCS93_20620 [Microscillaceae bacterium]|nr:hypothetical protein [Microscillaceae bacterium]